MKSILIKRFISFTEKLETSKKHSVTHLFNTIKNDAQSTTGSNWRNILLLLGKQDDYNVTTHDIRDIKYHPVQEENVWKVGFLKELVEIKHGDLAVDFENDEIDEIIEHLSTS